MKPGSFSFTALALAFASLLPAAAPIFSDAFELNGWTRLSSTGGLVLVETDPTFTNAPYAKINNAVYYVDLPAPLEGDFTLTLKVLHEKYSRSIVAGLTNADGTRGYGVHWGSHNANQFEGNGSVSLVKFADKAPVVAPQAYYGDLLTTRSNSGHCAAAEGGGLKFATFSLVWTAASQTLTLYVDGVQRSRATDPSFRSFSRIILGGGTGSMFDDVTLTSGPSTP